MSIPRLIGTVDPVQSGAPDARLIVLAPSLGTTTDLWAEVAHRLASTHRVLRFDLPGHGMSPATRHPFSVAELAEGVVRLVDSIGGGAFDYAGISLGGAIGLHLALGHPESLSTLTLASTGAKIGTSESWAERAAQVRASGTASVVSSSAARWYAEGFIEREPAVASRSFEHLVEVDDESYALCCEALATFDVTASLGSVSVPTLLIGGEFDVPTPAAALEAMASEIPDARYELLCGAAHLPAYERPVELGELIERHLRAAAGAGAAAGAAVRAESAAGAGAEDAAGAAGAAAAEDASGAAGAEGAAGAAGAAATANASASTYDAGMTVRREVLGDAHVDRATAAITPDTVDFQSFITRYAWGEIWTRPGLDRRSRSLLTLASLITGGHEKELAMHVRAALTNGLSRAEISEAVLHTAIYAGVPAANSAFAVVRETFAALDAAQVPPSATGTAAADTAPATPTALATALDTASPTAPAAAPETAAPSAPDIPSESASPTPPAAAPETAPPTAPASPTAPAAAPTPPAAAPETATPTAPAAAPETAASTPSASTIPTP